MMWKLWFEKHDVKTWPQNRSWCRRKPWCRTGCRKSQKQNTSRIPRRRSTDDTDYGDDGVGDDDGGDVVDNDDGGDGVGVVDVVGNEDGGDGVCVGDVICNDDGGDGVGVGDVVDGFVPILRNLLVVNKCLLSNSHLALWKYRTLQRLGEVFKLLFSWKCTYIFLYILYYYIYINIHILHYYIYDLYIFSYIFQTAHLLKVHLYILQLCNFISTPKHNLRITITKESIPLQPPHGPPKRKKAYNATQFFCGHYSIQLNLSFKYVFVFRPERW